MVKFHPILTSQIYLSDHTLKQAKIVVKIEKIGQFNPYKQVVNESNKSKENNKPNKLPNFFQTWS